MNKTLIATAIGLMAISASVTAQAPCGGFGPGYGPGWYNMTQNSPDFGGGAFPGKGGWGPEERKPEARIDRQLERMTARLGLSAEQQAQIRVILEEQGARRQAMREATRAQVDAVLNKEQRALHAQMMQARGQGKGLGGPGFGPGQGRRGQGYGWGPPSGFVPGPQ